MNQIFLLRHAEAENPKYDGRDFDRQLTSKGKADLKKETRGMVKLGIQPELILVSPLVRARETAEIVATELKCKKTLHTLKELSPGNSPFNLLEALEPYKKFDSVMLVGHEPNMSQFISLLVSGGRDTHYDFKKGGLALIEVGETPKACEGTLRWLKTPEELFPQA